MDTMMALRAHRRGGPETLVYEPAPMPSPADDEVLVAVHAAAITFTELTWDQTWTDADGADRTPIIPSHEVSGTVAAVGSDVTDLAIGDDVYGLIDFGRDGAAAQFVAVPASALAAKPSGVSHAEAATLPLAALTAWQALVDYASLAPGESVLVHGGAGGVGVYGIQIAGLRGARVIATGRPEQEDFIRGLGAHEFIDFTAVAFDDVLTDLDVVLDPVGGDTLTRSFRVLRAGGRLVTLSSPPPPDLANQFGVEATFFIVQPDRAELIDLARFVDGGSLRPVISQVFELPDGRAAFESANKPRQPGKTVLTVLR